MIYEIENLQQMVEDFFLILSINHDCMVEEQKDCDSDSKIGDRLLSMEK